MRTYLDLKYNDTETGFYDLYLPDGDSFDFIIWFHGGGFKDRTRKDIKFQEDMAKLGVAVASVEYRKYPDAKFPDYIEDGAEAVKYLMDNIHTYGNVKRTFISGQSAGAYLTMMLLLDEKYFKNAGVDRDKIDGYIADSAQMMTHFNVLNERGTDPRLERIDEAAPLYYLSESSDFKELLMLYYTDDLPGRHEQNQLFYQSYKRVCPEQKLTMVKLEGGHCNGSENRNKDGNYDYVEQFKKMFLN